MRTFAWSLAGGVVICTGALWLIWSNSGESSPQAEAKPLAGRVAEIGREVEDLSSRQAEILAALKRIEAGQSSATGERHGRGIAADPGTTVAATLAETATVDAEADLANSGDVLGQHELEDLESAFDVLLDPEASWDDKQKVWIELGKKGLIDEAVATFEARAEENPENPDAQTQLGNAYIQKLGTVSVFEQGPWAMKADRAFDAALELDDHHWLARFLKATSLSFWPAVTGKQEEAVRHFEVLLEQQEQLAPEAHFAETYEFLGNMYSNRRQFDKARAVWQKGAELFPERADFAKRLAERNDPEAK